MVQERLGILTGIAGFSYDGKRATLRSITAMIDF
jgi:hypothetical protein